jgi:uncharacterized protein YcfL
MRLAIASLLAAISVVTSIPVTAQSLGSKVEYIGKAMYVTISSIKVRTTNELLNLSVEFSNSDNSDQQAYYRISWVDAQGFPVWDQESWKPILLHGGQIDRVLIVSPTRKAQDFKIEFSADRNLVDSQARPRS